jgi:HAD superfamily hydrolase (TIGR01549 family)
VIKDLIYDFDGTLSDTYPLLTNVMLEILREHGVTDTYEQVYANFKVSVGYTVKQYDIGLAIEDFIKLLLKRYHEASHEKLQPFPEAKQLLADAVKAGKRNFIYTHSGKTVYEFLDKWGLSPYITFVLDSTYNFPNKPDPSALQYLLARFDIDPATALMIGDRDIDTDCGRNAGMKGCLFDPEHYYDDSDVDYRIDNLLQLKNII